MSNNLIAQIKNFFKGSIGRWGSVVATTLLTFLVMGSVAPDLIMLNIAIGMICAASFAILVISIYFKKQNDKVEGLVKNQDSKIEQQTKQIFLLNEQNKNIEETLTGKISILEHYTPNAIIEIVFPEMYFIHENDNFSALTGWSIKELNTKLFHVAENERIDLLVDLLFVNETAQIIKSIFYNRLRGDISPKQISNGLLRHKTGIEKPITFKTHLLKKENHRSLYHIFISDESQIRELCEIIENQQTMLKGAINKLSYSSSEHEDYANFIRKLQKETLEGLKKLKNTDEVK